MIGIALRCLSVLLIGIAFRLPVVRLQAASAAEPCASSASADAPFRSLLEPQNEKPAFFKTGLHFGADRDRTDYLLNAIQSL